MKNKKGLTLVEVIVAMALFAMIVPTVLYAFETALKINIVSDEFTDSNYLAQTEIENIYALSANLSLNDVLLTNLGYGTTCDTGISFCKLDSNNNLFEIVSSEYVAIGTNIETINLTVSNSKGDRAQIELYLRFGG